MESEGPPDFFAQPDTGASQPPEETANPFGAPAPQGSTGVEVPQTSPDQDPAPPGPEPTGPMDPDLFTAPAADSYAPAGTGTDGHPAETAASQRWHARAHADGTDARVAWRSKNAKELEKREEEEKAANVEVKKEAEARLLQHAKWLKEFNEGRSKRIAQDKKDNAAQESAATMGPTGDTDWAKVNSMVDFTFKPPQERETERERFKKLLFAAKDKNVPVTA